MKLLMAANWKMNKTRQQAADTLSALAGRLKNLPLDRDVVVFAPFTVLSACWKILSRSGGSIMLGGQNVYPADKGAFTGEISPAMLLDCGCTHVLVGHSERRAIMGERDDFVGKKTAFALEQGLAVLLCVGETLEERDSGKLGEVLERQLSGAMKAVPATAIPSLVSVAYEPVWAIGTGRVAGSEEILDAHARIRTFLEKHFGSLGGEIRILYGGSVQPEIAEQIISLDNVNGVLVGGASLQAETFSRIALA